MAKRARSGDVLVVTAVGGVILLHFLGRDPRYGDAVAVCPRLCPVDARPDEELFHDAYVTFYPVQAAMRAGLVTVAGSLPSPGVPRRLRRAGARSDSRVETWLIVEDGEDREMKRELSDEEARLPIASIWSHDLLIERVTMGWRPEVNGLS